MTPVQYLCRVMHMIGVKFVEVISVGRRYWLRYSTVTSEQIGTCWLLPPTRGTGRHIKGQSYAKTNTNVFLRGLSPSPIESHYHFQEIDMISKLHHFCPESSVVAAENISFGSGST
jgi:hypothetical protein